MTDPLDDIITSAVRGECECSIRICDQHRRAWESRGRDIDVTYERKRAQRDLALLLRLSNALALTEQEWHVRHHTSKPEDCRNCILVAEARKVLADSP